MNALINQIIKFEKEDKIKKLSLSNRNHNHRFELDKKYNNYINSKRKLNYKFNQNSSFAHKINTSLFLQGIKKTKRKMNEMAKNYITKEIQRKKDAIELKDKVEFQSLEMQDIKNKVMSFLSNDTKLNQIEINEQLFNKFENKINFLQDGLSLPNINNNLVKVNLKTEKNIYVSEQWKCLNFIGNSTLKYLNKLKAKIQREKDEGKRLFQNNEEIQINKTNLDITQNIKKNKEKNEEVEDIEEKENFLLNKNDSELVTNKKLENLYIYENYFVYKVSNYKNVGIVSKKIRSLIINNKDFIKENINNLDDEKNEKEEEKSKGDSKLEYDIYL